MKAVTLQEVSAAMGGRILGPAAAATVTEVRTDSRNLCAGCLFFALSGPRHDGHAYVNEALDGGAAVAVVRDLDAVDPAHHAAGRLIQVPDTLAALGRLAAWYRGQIAAQVVAVVGSCGKTTVKDMIAAVLGVKWRGRAAPASFNNAVGVPLTLLSADASDEFVVVEIGTNHAGEVAALGRIARPDMAVVANIGEEHLEFFQDLDGVAKEEFSILACMQNRSFVAINSEAAGHCAPRALQGHATLTYGFDHDADLRAVDLTVDDRGTRFKLNGRHPYRVPLLGEHNALNALGAIAIGARLRMTDGEIAEGLASVKPKPMRLERTLVGTVTLINDAYNANPTSMRAAFGVLDRLTTAGHKVLLLGDMAELGAQTERCHRDIGRDAGRSSAHVIAAIGTHARVLADGAIGTAGASKRIYSFPTLEAVTGKLQDLIKPGDVVLLKASRDARLERLVPHIEDVGRVALAS